MRGHHRLVSRLALLCAGIAIGALALSPVGAHVSSGAQHLWRDHIKSKADARFVNASGDSITKGLKARIFRYTQPRKHILNISHYALVPADETDPLNRSDSFGTSGESGDDDLFGNVSLPDGARITKFATSFHDTSAGTQLRCLLRFGPLTGGVDGVANVDSQGNNGFQVVQTTSIIDRVVVKNGAGFYYLQCGPLVGNWVGTTTAVKGVMIHYKLPAAP